MGDVGSKGDLWRNLSGEFLKFWTESLPDIDVQMLASVRHRGQQRLSDFVADFLSPPISDWRNGNIVFAADFCQANVGHAKFFGKGQHGSRPDSSVEFTASQANSFGRHSSLSYGQVTFPTSCSARTYLCLDPFPWKPRATASGSPRRSGINKEESSTPPSSELFAWQQRFASLGD